MEVNQFKSLRLEDRQRAHDRAVKAVHKAIGNAPQRKHYERNATSKYPPLLMGLITFLCVVILLFAFVPSAIRVHYIAFNTFPDAMGIASQSAAAVSMVTLAEVGVILMLLAVAILNAGNRVRGLLYGGAVACTVVAIAGNVEASGGWAGLAAKEGLFPYLETLVPPALVLLTSYVLKEQGLNAIASRRTAHLKFEGAMAEYEQRIAAPAEEHPRWQEFYINAIREQLMRVNARNRDALKALSDAEWYELVKRELDAANWYDAQNAKREHNASIPMQARSIAGGGGGQLTGELLNAVEQVGEVYTARCPHCDYVKTGCKSERAAKNALAAHFAGCKGRTVTNGKSYTNGADYQQ